MRRLEIGSPQFRRQLDRRRVRIVIDGVEVTSNRLGLRAECVIVKVREFCRTLMFFIYDDDYDDDVDVQVIYRYNTSALKHTMGQRQLLR